MHATSSVQGFAAAREVTQALSQWHRGGAASGDVKFWAPIAEHFDSPKAYAMVIETLLAKKDYVSSMSLLMHWLSQASRIELENAECSFHMLARQWVESLIRLALDESPAVPDHAATEGAPAVDDPWALLGKFFDYLDANAEVYGEAPAFELRTVSHEMEDGPAELAEGDEEDEEDLFGAAYDDVVYKDSTDDGIDGMIFEPSSLSDDALEREKPSERGRSFGISEQCRPPVDHRRHGPDRGGPRSSHQSGAIANSRREVVRLAAHGREATTGLAATARAGQCGTVPRPHGDQRLDDGLRSAADGQRDPDGTGHCRVHRDVGHPMPVAGAVDRPGVSTRRHPISNRRRKWIGSWRTRPALRRRTQARPDSVHAQCQELLVPGRSADPVRPTRAVREHPAGHRQSSRRVNASSRTCWSCYPAAVCWPTRGNCWRPPVG